MIRTANGQYYRDNAEISEAEYAALLSEIKAKAKWVDDISTGRANMDDCPEAWRAEIAERAERRRQERAAEEDGDATTEDYEAALARLGVEL